MASVRVLILRAAGTNCDGETLHAWELAGARGERVHVRRLIETPRLLRDFQVLTLPGGFSYGDDIAAGRILAAQVQRHLADDVHAFIDRGGLVLGICNGFQVLVQTGLLPGGPLSAEPAPRADSPRTCSVTYNDPPGFQDRWVYLRAGRGPCVFLEPGRVYEMPIAHGEGRVVFDRPARLEALIAAGQDALRFTRPDNGPNLHGEPYNPNGSVADLAGVCDATGRVLGLMPHPERFVTWTQHPCWTSLPERAEGDGLALFRRAVRWLGE